MQRGPDLELPKVVVDRPESMSLLGLLLRGVLVDNLAASAQARRALRLRGDLVVRAGEMAITLRFDGERVTIVEGASESARARVAGSVTDLLGIVSDGGLVGRVLAGRIRIGGDPLMLLRILPLVSPRRQDA